MPCRFRRRSIVYQGVTRSPATGATCATSPKRFGFEWAPRRTVVDHRTGGFMRAVVIALLFSACKNSPAADGPPQGGGERPPTEVGIVVVKSESVTLQTELAGRTTASLVSELRPQVTGIVKARTFEEGSKVKAGQVLYQIDPAMYRAQVQEAQ